MEAQAIKWFTLTMTSYGVDMVPDVGVDMIPDVGVNMVPDVGVLGDADGV